MSTNQNPSQVAQRLLRSNPSPGFVAAGADGAELTMDGSELLAQFGFPLHTRNPDGSDLSAVPPTGRHSPGG